MASGPRGEEEVVHGEADGMPGMDREGRGKEKERVVADSSVRIGEAGGQLLKGSSSGRGSLGR